MSLAFRSGTRHRSVDVSIDDGDEIPIDGMRLRQARIERGLSVTEAARLATLSREQIAQIESGGLGAFYGARHKLLAVRKYADSFGLSLEQLSPAQDAPAATAADSDSPPAPDAVADAVAEAVADRAEYAAETLAAEPEPAMYKSPQADGDLPGAAPPSAAVARWPLLLVVAIMLLLAFALLRGFTQEQSPASLPSADTPPTAASSALPPAVEPEAVPSSHASESPEVIAPVANNACALTAGPDTPRWTPAYARNASTRVFLTSATLIDVCVTDATGVSTPLTLRPGAMASASGKPPYVVRSERLSQAQIFLQGLKVRFPASATAIHLMPSQSVRAPEPPASTEE